MRRVVAAEYVSLDGVMEDPGPAGEFEHGGWTVPYWNDELASYQTELLFASGALPLGRVTYEEFVAAWPKRSNEDPFTNRMNSLPKFVASRTLTDPLPWNSTLLKGDVTRAVARLKQQPGQDLLIYGSNMFGPIRGAWPDDRWTGWWGDNPPYHTPVFVLTHHPREPIVMTGGTVFHFVTDGIEAALRRATDAANGQDIRLGGGVATIRQYLHAPLVDEMHVAISPVVLGSGESLFAGLDLPAMGYQCREHVTTANAMHVVFTRRP
jgi:dihydrofolate reductase